MMEITRSAVIKLITHFSIKHKSNVIDAHYPVLFLNYISFAATQISNFDSID